MVGRVRRMAALAGCARAAARRGRPVRRVRLPQNACAFICCPPAAFVQPACGVLCGPGGFMCSWLPLYFKNMGTLYKILGGI